jgi:hypothetical protein
MVNRDYTPTDTEDDIIDVMREERRANPYLIRQQTDLGKGDVNTALSNLTSAGWVRKVTRGLYEFVEDPRTGGTQDTMEKAEELLDEVEEADPVDPVEAALKGWSYGRSEEEQQANESVAVASLEWLRDTDEPARQSDVPLDELAEDDPEERTPDTLWRSVIRSAWQHAVGQGYVEQPNSRAYKWVGGNE